MPQKWYYKTMIPIPGFMYKISFLKKWENLHHYLTFLKGLSLESYSLLYSFYSCCQNFSVENNGVELLGEKWITTGCATG